MASSDNVPHVQAKFFTRQEQYSISDHPFSVPATVGISELSSLINSLLSQGSEDGNKVAFDFLIDGEFLRSSLQDHMEQHTISTETVVEVEYVEQRPAPQPEDSLVHDDWVSAVQASGDYILTGSYDNTVRVWTTEGDLVITIPGHSGPVKSAAWIKQDDDDPVHRFVTGSHDSTLLVWEWNQQRNAVDCVHTCRGHAGSVDCVAVDPTKTKFCSGSWDRMLKIWSTEPTETLSDSAPAGEKPQKRKKVDNSKEGTRVPLMTLSGHNEGVSAALWLSDKEVCTSSWDHSIRTWDIETGEQKSTLMGSKVFLDISYSPLSKTIVAASADRHIRLYDPRITDGQLVKSTFTSHNGWVAGVDWSPTNEYEFVSGAYDSLMKLWDTRSPKAPIYDLAGHDDKILAVDWSVPQYLMSGGVDNHLKVFKYNEKNSWRGMAQMAECT